MWKIQIATFKVLIMIIALVIQISIQMQALIETWYAFRVIKCLHLHRTLDNHLKDYEQAFKGGWIALTHYQTTNFRLFQTERVCRRQFQIWWKWQKVIQIGRKHCGKRRNCSLRAFLFFPQCFQKACFPAASKGVIVCECVKLLSLFISLYQTCNLVLNSSLPLCKGTP